MSGIVDSPALVLGLQPLLELPLLATVASSSTDKHCLPLLMGQ
jgi:hypothetical protein